LRKCPSLVAKRGVEHFPVYKRWEGAYIPIIPTTNLRDTEMSKYLDGLSPADRFSLLAPSKDLLKMQAFKAEYLRAHPGAYMNEVVEAYQRAENAKLPEDQRNGEEL
jgi:hypothetical protein